MTHDFIQFQSMLTYGTMGDSGLDFLVSLSMVCGELIAPEQGGAGLYIQSLLGQQ